MAARAPSPRHLSPEGLKILSLELPYCPHTPTRPFAFTPRTPKAPHEPPEALSLTPSTVNGMVLPTGTSRIPQVGIPFSFPPLPLPQPRPHPLLDDSGHAHGVTSPSRGRERRRSEAEAPRPEANLPGCESPPPLPELSSQGNGVAKRGGNASFVRNLRGPASHITPRCTPASRDWSGLSLPDHKRDVLTVTCLGFCQPLLWNTLVPTTARAAPLRLPRGGEGALTNSRDLLKQ